MTKLNLGCGNDIQKGYINIDVRKTHPSVIIEDVCSLPYKDIDEIRAIDVYEHVSWRKSQDLLNHWVNILKPGGKLFIQGPDIEEISKWILHHQHDPKILNKMIGRIFGGQDYPENTHLTSIHKNSIYDMLRLAGINGNIEFETNFGNKTNIRITAYK